MTITNAFTSILAAPSLNSLKVYRYKVVLLREYSGPWSLTQLTSVLFCKLEVMRYNQNKKGTDYVTHVSA